MTRRFLGVKQVRVLMLLAGSLLVAACSEPDVNAEPPTRVVRVQQVGVDQVLTQRRFVGRVDALSTVDLSFQVGGRLLDLSAKKASLVRKGSVLARLDAQDFQLLLQQAQAQLNLAQLDVTRKRNLFASGSLPKALLDQAETQVQLLQVAVKTAQRNVSYTQIVAPFDALVSERLVDNFSNVLPLQPIIRIQELTELRVRIHIPEAMVALLEHPEAFNVDATFADRPTESYPLVYKEHRTEASSVAQTYEVSFGLSRAQNPWVLPGMTASVVVRAKQAPVQASQFLIPLSALDHDEHNQPRVWLFDSHSQTVSARLISLGAMHKQGVVVLSGLQAGDSVVTAGAHLLREGLAVRRFESF